MPTKKVSLCKKDLHPMTRSNTYVHPTKGKLCRECLRDYQRDYMVEWRAAKEPARPAKKRKPAAAKRKPAAKKARASRPAARAKARKRARSR